MAFHTYDPERAPDLEDESRYRYLSREELVALLDPEPEWTVADLGSGTGFYTDDLAPFVDACYAVDVEPKMHDYYEDKGLPENVDLVTAEIADLPFADGELDGAFSTMTFHEFATDEALAELARVTASGAPVAIGDWTRNGSGESGPPTDERYDLATAEAMLAEAEFSVEYASERPETFVVRAVA